METKRRGVSELCRYCNRIVAAPCRNTRDMDPVDGLNNDGECRAVLIRLGGGERGHTDLGGPDEARNS
jgi:hypothetical protein